MPPPLPWWGPPVTPTPKENYLPALLYPPPPTHDLSLPPLHDALAARNRHPRTRPLDPRLRGEPLSLLFPTPFFFLGPGGHGVCLARCGRPWRGFPALAPAMAPVRLGADSPARPLPRPRHARPARPSARPPLARPWCPRAWRGLAPPSCSRGPAAVSGVAHGLRVAQPAWRTPLAAARPGAAGLRPGHGVLALRSALGPRCGPAACAVRSAPGAALLPGAARLAPDAVLLPAQRAWPRRGPCCARVVPSAPPPWRVPAPRAASTWPCRGTARLPARRSSLSWCGHGMARPPTRRSAWPGAVRGGLAQAQLIVARCP
jgi:hypothetical protein|eukprot:XP_020393697.1 splicing factor 3A subunit 2-like [Zea mays]